MLQPPRAADLPSREEGDVGIAVSGGELFHLANDLVHARTHSILRSTHLNPPEFNWEQVREFHLVCSLLNLRHIDFL